MEFAIWRPPADILYSRERWLIKLELPGVRIEDLDISVQGRHLRVSGIRRDLLMEQGLLYHSLEISYSRFERTVELPFIINPDMVRWHYQDGMLVIDIKREGRHER